MQFFKAALVHMACFKHARELALQALPAADRESLKPQEEVTA
jgi:hypothetical protein